MKRYVFMVEERSMEVFLSAFLDHNGGITRPNRKIIPHSGKSDLKRSIPAKLRALNDPDTLFVILIDQDSNDCMELKKEMAAICDRVPNAKYKIRVVCHELESWYLGDAAAIDAAFNTKLTTHAKNRFFRAPDDVPNPKQVLRRYIKNEGQIYIANKMGVSMTRTSCVNNRSRSFKVFMRLFDDA